MAQKSSDQSQTLNVLIFKDDLRARSFQIPLGWFSSFGTLLLLLVALFFSASFFALKFYRSNQKMDPTRMIELEREVKDLKLANVELKQELDANNGIVQATSPTQTQDSQIDPNPAGLAPVANENSITANSIPLFNSFSPKTRLLSKDGAIPIRIDRLSAGWSKDTLKVDFNILYVAQDNGSQQGHIVVVARGPGHLLAHPDQALNPTTDSTLISPDRGEYFSVSRFRATTASFPGISQRNWIKQVQVYLFNKENNIILSEAILVSPTRSAQSQAPQQTTPVLPREEPKQFQQETPGAPSTTDSPHP